MRLDLRENGRGENTAQSYWFSHLFTVPWRFRAMPAARIKNGIEASCTEMAVEFVLCHELSFF